MSASTIARRAPVGNLIYRTAGVFLVGIIVGLWPLDSVLNQIPDPVLWFHIGFNTLVGGLGLCTVRFLANQLDKVLPSGLLSTSDEIAPLSMENLQDSKNILVTSQEELERSLALLERYWSHVAWLIKNNPPTGEILRLEDDMKLITRRSRAISRLLMILTQEPMTLDEAQLWQKYKNLNASIRMATEVASAMINSLSRNKCQDGLVFSELGRQELLHEHQRVALNISRIRTLLTTQEPAKKAELLAQLGSEQIQMHQADYSFIESHMARVAKGQTASVATGALHLELLTLFRHFNGILCALEE